MTTVLTETTDPMCLSSGESAALLESAPWRRFAVIGDSLSAGTGDSVPGYASLGWSDRVADVLRLVHARAGAPGFDYLNVAEVGASTKRTLATQIDALTSFRPDLLHVPCGANDLFHDRPDYVVIEQRLRSLFGVAADTGALLTSFTLGRAFVVPAYADFAARVRRLNDIVRAVAADHDAVLVDMWDHPLNARPDLLSADGIHFAAAGQAVLATEVVRALGRRTAVALRA